MNKFLIIAFFTLILLSCKKDVKDLPNDLKTTNYKVTFNINWNSSTYPNNYPSNAHFSKLIGWTHQSKTEFFKEGTLASAGIKDMAELGATTPLDKEIETKIAIGEGLHFYIGNNLATGIGTIEQVVTVDKNHPSVTLATMLAPSPDWYLAVVNINLLENDEFVASKTVSGIVYDAGTDDGATYVAANSNTYPRRAISYFVSQPLGNDTVISPAIASVTFTKQ